MQFSIKKINDPIKKWAEDLNRLFFFQRKHMDGKQAPEKKLNMPNREMQIKTIMRY